MPTGGTDVKVVSLLIIFLGVKSVLVLITLMDEPTAQFPLSEICALKSKKQKPFMGLKVCIYMPKVGVTFILF